MRKGAPAVRDPNALSVKRQPTETEGDALASTSLLPRFRLH